MLTMHKDGLFSTLADAARPALHLRVHPAALPTQDNLLHSTGNVARTKRRFPQDAVEIASPGSLSSGMHSLHQF